MDNVVNNTIDILNYAIEQGVSARKASSLLGKGDNYVSNNSKKIEERYKDGRIDKKSYNAFLQIKRNYEEVQKSNDHADNTKEYNIFNNSSKNNQNDEYQYIREYINSGQAEGLSSKEIAENLRMREHNAVSIIAGIKAAITKSNNKYSSSNYNKSNLSQQEIEDMNYDANLDLNYDQKKSFGKPNRDGSGKIINYHYQISMKDKKPLVGEFSRSEMDTIYKLYSSYNGSNLDMREVARCFPTINYRDFKRILRAFNITKASIPIAPHNIEELSPEDANELVFQNKERNFFRVVEKSNDQRRELSWRQAMIDAYEIRKSKEVIQEMLKNIPVEGIKPFKIEKKAVKEEMALFVYLSDMHVGAHTSNDSIFNNEYNEQEFNARLEKVLKKIKEQSLLMGRFDKVVVFNLGDALDGYNAQTTRGGHSLPQNLDNKEQFRVYISGMRKFFATLHDMNVANNIEFISVGNDNHSGDFGFMANQALCWLFQEKYPEMHTRVFDKFIETVDYGKHTFIVYHGKDDQHMKHGHGLHLSDKIENYFIQIVDANKMKNPYIHVVKGDLHQTASMKGKRFRYKNVASLYGGSDWIHTNFGPTKPAVDFEIISKNENIVMEFTLELK